MVSQICCGYDWLFLGTLRPEYCLITPETGESTPRKRREATHSNSQMGRNVNLHLESRAHVCHLYSDSQELKAVTLGLIREGVRSGDHVMFMTPDPADDWYFEFQ